MGLTLGLILHMSRSCWDLDVQAIAERLCEYLQTQRAVLVLSKLKNGQGSPDQITAEALLLECLEKLARSLSVMCWDMNFPEDWLCSLTVMAPKVMGATCLSKFTPMAGLCAMRKILGSNHFFHCSAKYAALQVRVFLPLLGPANPSEVGVLFFGILCSFEFSRDRHCHGTRKCPHRLSSDKLLRVAVPSQWRTNTRD